MDTRPLSLISFLRSREPQKSPGPTGIWIILLVITLLASLAGFSTPASAQDDEPVCTVEFKQNGSHCNVQLEITDQQGQIIISETFFESDREVLSMPCGQYSYTATVLNSECLPRDYSTVAGIKGEVQDRFEGSYELKPGKMQTIFIPGSTRVLWLVLLLVVVLAAALLFVYYRRKD